LRREIATPLFVDGSGAVCAQMDCDAPPDCEIFLDYGGRRPNDDLLMHYGFVSADNPHDTVDISIPPCVHDAAARSDIQGDLVTQALDDMIQPGMPAAFKAAPTGVDLRIKRLLRIVCMDASAVPEILDAHMADGGHHGNFCDSNQDDELERRILDILSDACTAALKLATPDAPECSVSSDGEDRVSSLRAEAASLFRSEKRRVLRSLQCRLGSMRGEVG